MYELDQPSYYGTLGSIEVDENDLDTMNESLGARGSNRLPSPGRYYMMGNIDRATGKVSQSALTPAEPRLGTNLFIVNVVETGRLEETLDKYKHQLRDGVARDGGGHLNASHMVSLGLEAIVEAAVPGSGVVLAPLSSVVRAAVVQSDPTADLAQQVKDAQDAVLGVGDDREGEDFEESARADVAEAGSGVGAAVAANETRGVRYLGPIESIADDFIHQRTELGLIAHRAELFHERHNMRPGLDPFEVAYDGLGANLIPVHELSRGLSL